MYFRPDGIVNTVSLSVDGITDVCTCYIQIHGVTLAPNELIKKS